VHRIQVCSALVYATLAVAAYLTLIAPGDMSCDNCFSLSTSGCTDVRVTNAACSILLRFQVSLITLWPKLIPQSKVTVPIAVDAEIRA
jgi:hypothetical protein